MPRKRFDAVGVGLNAMDQFRVVSRHPAVSVKSRIPETAREGGGQAATTMAALPRLGEVKAFLRAHAS